MVTNKMRSLVIFNGQEACGFLVPILKPPLVLIQAFYRDSIATQLLYYCIVAGNGDGQCGHQPTTAATHVANF